jgi:hypothetical protein
MDYYKKYLKYKDKYLLLKKKQKGGDEIASIRGKLGRNSIRTYCPKIGFKQHSGQCWNDTVQTLMCFTDGIKETVQKKLWNLTVEEILSYSIAIDRYDYLPNYIKYNKTKKDRTSLENFESKLMNYFQLLQKRLCSYYLKYENIEDKDTPKIREKCSTFSNEDTCPTNDPNIRLLYGRLPPLKRSPTAIVGIEPAIIAHELTNSDGSIIKRTQLLLENSDGGIIEQNLLLYTIFSTIFLDDKDFLDIKNYDLENNYEKNKINMENIDEALCVEIRVRKLNRDGDGHVIGFFICNGNEYFYDDNTSIEIFLWKNYLKFYITHMDIYDMVLAYGTDDSGLFSELLFYDKKLNCFYRLQDDKLIDVSSNYLCKNIDIDYVNNKNIYYVKNLTFIKNNIYTDYSDYINKNANTLLKIEKMNTDPIKKTVLLRPAVGEEDAEYEDILFENYEMYYSCILKYLKDGLNIDNYFEKIVLDDSVVLINQILDFCEMTDMFNSQFYINFNFKNEKNVKLNFFCGSMIRLDKVFKFFLTKIPIDTFCNLSYDDVNVLDYYLLIQWFNGSIKEEEDASDLKKKFWTTIESVYGEIENKETFFRIPINP